MGVIGAGSFGTAVSNLLAENGKVYLYARNKNALLEGKNAETVSHPNIIVTDSIEEICERSYMLIPVVPSAHFKEMITDFSPFLRPDHLIIHASKGLHCEFDIDTADAKTIHLKDIKTMSQLILEATSVARIGCLAGPNLAAEIADRQPAATVIASRFDEVIREGKSVLKSERFQVYGSKDLLGVEFAGVLKNYIALAAGIMEGVGYGGNTKAWLIARGLGDMIRLGKAMGADKKAFLGIAGIGDLVATCSSTKSRNFMVGFRLAKGEKLEEILSSMSEVAEGVRTLKIAKLIADSTNTYAPLLQGIYSVVYENMKVEECVVQLMNIPVDLDADYLDS